MKPQSAKAKGRKLQQWTRDQLMSMVDTLEPGDIESRSMGANGTDIVLSPAARKLLPFAIECKNLAKFSGYTYYAQAKANTKEPDVALVVVKQNKSQPLVLLSWEDFQRILTGEI